MQQSINFLQKLNSKSNRTALLKLIEQREEWALRPEVANLFKLIKQLPQINCLCDMSKDYLDIQFNEKISSTWEQQIEEVARILIPWRKGPIKLGELFIDAEWQSQLKWNRIKDKLPKLENKKILDVGSNDGYYLFKMLEFNPFEIIGIDPTVFYLAQFNFLQHFVRDPRLSYALIGVEHTKYFKNEFDVIFSMGVLYHHRHPLEQLLQLKDALKPGGELVIETIGIPGEESHALFPQDRYAKMRNVWFLPTLPCLINWLSRTHFIEIEVLSNTQTSFIEQRLTEWCPPPRQSLQDFLTPHNVNLTIEGHPAPRRFCLKAKKKN